MSTQHQHIGWINNLRIVALFAVIVLHASAVLLSQYGKVPPADWLAADIYNAAVRFSVPVFVMITGALLLPRDYELGDFFKKRLSKIITPFLFWSLVYIWYSWHIDEISFDNDAWTDVKQVLHLLKTGSSYHLWYVYMLIGLYLVIPILSRFVKASTEKELRYFILMWLLIMLLTQPFISRFNPAIDERYFTGYIGYLVLGHYLAYQQFTISFMQRKMLMLFVLTAIVIAAGTWWFYFINSPYGTFFYEPLSLFIVLLSGSAFLAARFSRPVVSPLFIRIRDFVGSFNYGIYLAHALLLYLLDDLLRVSYKLCNPFISIPVTALLCFGFTLLLVWLINKIPVVGRWISG
jgi:surface polysaccharide O-acyltransferase-like enzyme